MTANFSLFALTLYALGYAMLFAALLLVSYYPPAGGAGTTLTVWLYTALGTLSGHMLGNAQGKKLDVAPDPQGGFASVRLLIVLAAISLGLMLAGCTSVMRGYEAAAVNEIKAADDNTLALLKTAFCAQPLSAFIRNSDLVPGAVALCLPGGNATNPANLLPGAPAVKP